MAAISLQFPNSGLLQRIKIIQDANAKAFFSKWPSAVKAQEDLSLTDSDISTLFHETPTRHAVSAMSLRLRGLEDTAQAQTHLMECLISHMDPLSPSKQPSGGKGAIIRFPCSASASVQHHAEESTVPLRALENDQDVHMSSPPSSPTLCPCQLFDSNLPFGNLIPVSPFCSPTRSASNEVTTFPTLSSSRPTDIFIPYILNINQKTYYVLPILPLLPDQPQSRSSHDLIIPSLAAYSPQVLPTFKKSETNWQSVFSRVMDPVKLWDCYVPRSLGDYPDVKSIWQSWSEGAIIEDIGRLPPIQLIENKWGSLKNGTMGKGRLPSWRPRNDAKVWFHAWHTSFYLH
ncbi:uncharacterized protein EV420DRAFT_789452 [Desarmillaria tabescens]|uniref:Uncharacterized protein n=1 Tax=Armillaria tabescens TaxID=1929756 RepID=A0AA39MWD7_ARMTA|nr:uncharacterized protein EV420DRAFT_789452 [Desarmillaria tabescens]KAK0449057.1 hypothetical protein EV420DRAFT_789452 [Desarmillaria tabescens]